MAETASGIYYPTPGDPFRPASVDLKKLAESVEGRLAGIKGDATLAKDGTLTVADGAITSRKFKPTVGIKRAESDVTLSEAWKECPMVGGNLSVTPAVASYLLLWGQFSVNHHSGSYTEVRFTADAENREPVKVLGSAELIYTTLPLYDVVPLKAGEAHTIKVEARFNPAVFGCKFFAAKSLYMYELVAA